MGLTTINGLPAHVLLVHLAVVLVPVTAIMVVLSAAWPAARRRLGIGTPIVALVTTVVVPVTTDAGEWLERRVPRDPLVEAHTKLGDELLPWTIGLLAVAVLVWALQRHGRRTTRSALDTAEGTPAPPQAPRWFTPVAVVLIVAGLVAAGGSVVQVYRIGDSGAKASWHDGFSPNPLPGSGPDRDGG